MAFRSLPPGVGLAGGFRSQLYHLLALCLGASYLHSLLNGDSPGAHHIELCEVYVSECMYIGQGS